MNVPGLAPSTRLCYDMGGPADAGQENGLEDGRGKMLHSYAPEELRIQL